MFMYFTFFLTVTGLIFSVTLRKKERKHAIGRRIALATRQENQTEADQSDSEKVKRSLRSRYLLPFYRLLKRVLSRKISRTREQVLDLKLQQAGQPFGMSSFDYRIIRSSLCIVLPVLFVLYSKILHTPPRTSLIYAIIGILAGFLMPALYLRLKAGARSKKALRELPDILDLLTVSLEAGLGFDAALSKLVTKMDGVLSSELLRCLEEIRLGKTRRDALNGVRSRIVCTELNMLISSILQAEKLGIGMVQVLRTQSGEVREQRKRRAEEQAMKAPVKMMFPLVLFIFPSLFIVVLGPAVIQFLQTFHK